MMVTRRSSSSELSSPALVIVNRELDIALYRPRNDSPLVQIDVGLLADDVGVPPTNTLDLGQGVHDFALSIDVGVQQTENVLAAIDFSPASEVQTGCVTWNCWWASGTTRDMVAGGENVWTKIPR